jgi:hypothetical protein
MVEKSNSAAEICSVNQIDRTDPRNEGVVSDHLVGTPGGVQLRRIVYTNPVDGVTCNYLTNDHTDQRPHPARLSDRPALQAPLGHREDLPPVLPLEWWRLVFCYFFFLASRPSLTLVSRSA